MNEEVGFHVERDKIQSLDTNIVNMTAESLNFWLTKFVEEVCKEDGECPQVMFSEDRFPLRFSNIALFAHSAPCD